MAKPRKPDNDKLDMMVPEPPLVNVTKRGRGAKPASNPAAREQQLISLAVNLAEQQLRDGTASSQVITHFLKLGTKREAMEREILSKQAELLGAKTESIKQGKYSEQLVENAIAAMKSYSPTKDD